jgi:hypothetical protein
VSTTPAPSRPARTSWSTVTTSWGPVAAVVGQLPTLQGEPAYRAESVSASLTGSALVAVAGGRAQRVDRGTDDRGGLDVQAAGQPYQPVGLVGQRHVPAGLGARLGGDQRLQLGLLGQVGGDMGQNPLAEAAQDHRIELPGPIDQKLSRLVGHLLTGRGRHVAHRLRDDLCLLDRD